MIAKLERVPSTTPQNKDPTPNPYTRLEQHHKMDEQQQDWGYKTFFMFNSAEHEIYPAQKC